MGEGGARSPELAGLATAGAVAAAEGVCVRVGRRVGQRALPLAESGAPPLPAPTTPHSGRPARSERLFRPAPR